MIAMCCVLSPEKCDRLAYAWVDRCVRVHTAAALERVGHRVDAHRLRDLDQLYDRARCVQARDALVEIGRGIPAVSGDEKSALACIRSLTSAISLHVGEDGPDLYWVAVGTLTAARCAGAMLEEHDQVEDVYVALGDEDG
jgi:hypothetical protein